ncbi:kinesin-like protein subito [Dendroctonus ponderosae]|uniref:kinesin-like protein subito n=1 Tax=Dendroctonus ponderosae TaxID=77166 RepID=UPI002036032E|nr:kinesin-like protein subito [Dendroctonus ponderosae]KAH1023991.1 hypothetical protein HUJ05_003560 [Dendroctonus ponderosae]
MAGVNNQFPCSFNQASFLRARDPSILSWNRHAIEKVRCNLATEFSSVRSGDSESQKKKDETLNVYLRIKGRVPFGDLYTIEDNVLSCIVPASSQAAKLNRQNRIIIKKFSFSKIFGPHTTQDELFDVTVREKVLDFINGANGSLLTYGVSGAGKTYTMIGTPGDPGIIPRALNYIFRTVCINPNSRPCCKPMPNGKIEILSRSKQEVELQVRQGIFKDQSTSAELLKHERTFLSMQNTLKVTPVGVVDFFPPIFEVWVSFVEIYNENIFDLLEVNSNRGQQRTKLQIGTSHRNTYIKGVKHIFVTTGLEAYQILQFGLHNISYASTNLNMHSSRAHCIFSIKLVSGNNCEEYNVSNFNFCDLAGSERMKKTLNEGDRAKESSKINTSLSVLGRCIRSVREMQKNNSDICSAPFRDSKLTQLLQQALQGKENICMIVNMSPSPETFDENQQALIFSTIAQEVVVKEPKANPSQLQGAFRTFRQSLTNGLCENDFSGDELKEARNDIARLTLEMSEMKQNFEIILDQETSHLRKNYNIILNIKTEQLAEAQQEIERLKKSNNYLEKTRSELHWKLNKLEEQQETIVLSDSEQEDEENSSFSTRKEDKVGDIEEQHLLQVKLLEDKIKRLEAIIREKESEADDRRLHDEENRKRLDELNCTNSELRDEIRKLELTLHDAVRDYYELEEQEKSLRIAFNDLTARNCVLEDKNILLMQELDEYRNRCLLQQQELDDLKNSNTEDIIN